jgi:hypothetical protein
MVTKGLGVWTADDCALILIDYQSEMFEVEHRRIGEPTSGRRARARVASCSVALTAIGAI